MVIVDPDDLVSGIKLIFSLTLVILCKSLIIVHGFKSDMPDFVVESHKYFEKS